MKVPHIIIIGSGGAALCAAIEAMQFNVAITLVTKHCYQQAHYIWSSMGGCTWKTHGFNAAIGKDDSVAQHIEDTLKGGGYANHPKLAQTLCEGAVELVEFLQQLGVEFDKETNNQLLTRPFGGCGTPRSIFKEDRLGFYIQKMLFQKVKVGVSAGKITLLENLRAIKILKNAHNDITGIRAIKSDTLEYIDLYSDAVILADGGGASMYSPSAASADKSCDGIAMALDVGCSIIDMEFVQFHPTGIASSVPTFDGSLVEEVLRFDGGILLNKHNKRFMLSYHEAGETATRDEVSRGIYSEILKGNAVQQDAVILNISACRDRIKQYYPALFERLKQAGYDPQMHEQIYVRPTAHFLMGGVKIDEHSQTEVLGIFAAGETAGGVHGANRLGGNGLSEALVFGRIAGMRAAEYVLNKTSALKSNFTCPGLSFTLNTRKPLFTPDILMSRLRRHMYWLAGPVRSIDKLKEMQLILEDIKLDMHYVDITTGARAAYQVQQYFDLQNMLKSSEMIVRAALRRKESRGAHYLEEYPHTLPTFIGTAFCEREGALVMREYGYEECVWKKENIASIS